MPLTQTQIEKRREGIGASDVAGILGLDPFRTAWDIMAEKRDLLTEKNGTDYQEAGNILEPAILEWARRNIGELVVPTQAIRDPKGSRLAANPDGMLIVGGIPVEAKSHLQYTNEHWGEPGTDDVPDRVVVQATAQMMCCEQDQCHVVALLPVRLFVPFIVRFDKGLVDAIRQAVDEFWLLKESGGWPEAQPSASIIKRIKREPKTIVVVPEPVYVAARDTRQARLDAEKAEKVAFADLMQHLGTAEAATCGAGTFTYLEQRTAPKLDKERLEIDHPDLLAKYQTENTCRVPRFKKA